MNGSHLEPFCELKELRFLTVSELTGVPDCLGRELLHLQYLDLRGNRFTTSLPSSLGNLKELVEVIGFEQNVYEYAPPFHCRSLQCRPTYETLFQESGEKGENTWICGGLSQDLSTMPFFGARKLEKFWWDMNDLTATPEFFIKAVASWPSLRTLDLYDNRIRVSILALEPLKKLRHLRQVLIQRNFLHGTLDAAFFTDWPEQWTVLNIALNGELGGCLSPKSIPRWLELFHAGSRVRVDESCGSQGPEHSSWGMPPAAMGSREMASHFGHAPDERDEL